MTIYLPDHGWNDKNLAYPVTGVSVLLVASIRLKNAAIASGLKTVWYEDNYFDRVDYTGHGQNAKGSSYHYHFQNIPHVTFKDSRGMGMAVDANVVYGQEMAWFRSKFSLLAAHGVAYNVEGDHLHLDCGPWVSGPYGKNWTKPSWVGRPSNGLLVEDGQFGAATTRSLQRMLTRKRMYSGSIDGIFGGGTARGLQKLVGTTVDGSWGPASKAALARKLGTKTAWGSKFYTWLLQQQLNVSEVGLGVFR